jgi:hypothetical protein
MDQVTKRRKHAQRAESALARISDGGCGTWNFYDFCLHGGRALGASCFPCSAVMGHISFVGKLDGETLKAGATAIAPGWTLELMAKHSMDFWLTSEDLPDPNNRVTLDREGNIVLSYRSNNEEGHKRLISKLEDLMKKQTKCAVHGHECHQGLFSRNLFIGQRIPLAGVAHQNGTIRFGRDPKTSALDVNCKAHM